MRKKRICFVLFCIFVVLGTLLISIMVYNSRQDKFGLSNPQRNENNIVTWNCIYFGTYPQNDTNKDGEVNQRDKKEPIKWRVLAIEGKDAFLLADSNLDCQPYHREWGTVAWSSCTLRQWLNEDFYKTAFTAEEQSAIQKTSVLNNIGDDTSDKVYLLSYEEICNEKYGFSRKAGANSKTREAKNTTFVEAQGVISSDDMTGGWWLRSYDVTEEVPQRVDIYGAVDSCISVAPCSSQTAVRPVIHLDLSKAEWIKADNVNCLGTGFSSIEKIAFNEASPGVATLQERSK